MMESTINIEADNLNIKIDGVKSILCVEEFDLYEKEVVLTLSAKEDAKYSMTGAIVINKEDFEELLKFFK